MTLFIRMFIWKLPIGKLLPFSLGYSPVAIIGRSRSMEPRFAWFTFVFTNHTTVSLT